MIGAYVTTAAVCRDHDPRAFEVAGRVAAAVREREPALRVEHIGSTAVAGCAGKGVVDLLILYPTGLLDEAKHVLAELGFQPQSNRDPFPESRPMRVGSLEHQGAVFLIHAHVVADGCEEAGELIGFRDLLRSRPDLTAAYVARKREILASGITDPVDYCEAKGPFVRSLIDSGGH
jgi:GrpB-like predicted nucleotidyltransferase (UPF0157 family)